MPILMPRFPNYHTFLTSLYVSLVFSSPSNFMFLLKKIFVTYFPIFIFLSPHFAIDFIIRKIKIHSSIFDKCLLINCTKNEEILNGKLHFFV